MIDIEAEEKDEEKHEEKIAENGDPLNQIMIGN